MAKFREFLRKYLLADTDYLVGHDADGRYIRISRADLAASVAAIAAVQTLAVQYSANGESWHDSYTAGDHYTRIKAGSGAWSAAIPLCVSAYDIWRRQGNSGSEDDFIASLQGPAGAPADLSGVTIQNIEGYAEFLQQVHAEVANAKNAIVDEVTDAVGTAMAAALASKLDKDLSNLDAVTYMGNGAYIPIMTKSGMVKVSAEDLSAYIGVKSRVDNSSIETAIKSQRQTMAVSTTPNGSTTTFALSSPYTLGTSAVYLNGNRLYAGRDYTEVNAYTIEFIGWTPEATDTILFEAIPLSVSNPNQGYTEHDDQ